MGAELVLAVDIGVIIVCAAVLGLLATRTGQPSIVAYILAGLLIGPAVLGLVSVGELTETMAELGLAFLLFLLGIKMRFEDIKHLVRPIVKVSIPQMALVCLIGIGVAVGLGFPFWESILIGLAVMFSSTAVVIKMLTQKGEATAVHGKLDVGILLVQDIVVVILLAFLATGRPDSVTGIAGTIGTILVLIALLGIVAMATSRYVLPHVFRRVARNPDVFFLIAVSWAFLFIFVSQEFDLSIEMGAFLAGLAIAQLPYSKELQGRINPLTDLFIMVFFVSVGLQLEAADLFAHWQEAVIAAAILIPAKFVIFFALIDWQAFDVETTVLASLNMVQVSEFGLVVGALGVASGFIDEPVLGFLSLIALITMGVSVYLIQYNEYLLERGGFLFDRWRGDEGRAFDQQIRWGHAIIVGYDDVAREAIDVIEENYDIVFVDRDPDNAEYLEREGHDVVFGDFRHEAVRTEAGVSRAAFVLSCTVEPDVNKTLLGDVGEETTVFVEAEWVDHVQEYYELGADYVILSAVLAVERLETYLETYLEEPHLFDDVIEEDLRRAHAERSDGPEVGSE